MIAEGVRGAVSASGEVWLNAVITTGVNAGQTTEADPCLFIGHIYSPSIE